MKRKPPWDTLPALHGKGGGCLNCGPRPLCLTMNSRIAVGFGMAGIFKDGKPIWMEDSKTEFQEMPTLRKFELMARKDPDHDWQAIMEGPLSGRPYQRHGPNQWMLVKQRLGFA